MKTIKLTMILFTVSVAIMSCGKGKTVATGDAENAAKAGENNTTYVVNPSASSFAWIGKKVTGQHNGTINIASGEIKVEKNEITAGKFAVDMNSIKVIDLTDAESNKNLTGHLASPDFFDIANHPTTSFEITGVEKLGATGANGETHNIKGNLTIKGITKNIVIPAKVTISGNELKAYSKFAIDRTEWDIKYNSGKFASDLGDKMINDAIELELSLVATPKA